MARIQIPRAFEFLFQPASYKAAYGGRGGAKSESFARASVILSERMPLQFLCCREIQRSIKDSVKKVIEEVITDHGLQDRFISTRDEIVSDIGGRFNFSGLRDNATSIRSRKGDQVIWVEEANTVSQASLDILLPTLRTPWPDGRDPEFWFSWNPRYKTDPVDKFIRSNAPPGAFVREVHYDANPFFPPVLRKLMEWDRLRDPDKYRHVWLGGYAEMTSSRVFRNWTIGVAEIPESARPYYGIDFGFANSPTVANRCWIIGNILYIDREVSQLECTIEKTADLLDDLDEKQMRQWPARADSARPETIAHLKAHGYSNIRGARKGPGSIVEGIEFIKSFDVVVHPNCKFTIDNFTLYSYETDKLTDEVLPKMIDANNDHVDAIRYAIEDERRGGRIVPHSAEVTQRTFVGQNTEGMLTNPALGDGAGTRGGGSIGLDHLGIKSGR